MGWIMDAINRAIKWVVDKIFKPIITAITNFINMVTVEIRIARHQIIKDIAVWLSNDFNFFITFIGAVVLGVFWPRIWLLLKDITEKFLQSAMVQAIRDGILSITDSMFWINVETLHLILKVVWPQYTKMMGQFSQAVSGLADELGEGSGYIHAVFQLQKAVAFNTGALLGMDPRATEMEAYNKTAEFTRRIDNNFRRYAYNPGLIYSDFLEQVVIPSATDLKDTQQALVTTMREQHDRNVSMDRAITGIETAVDTFIEDMPDEIAEQIERRWEPIKDWMEENYHSLVDRVLLITGELTEIMELRQSRIEQANAYAQERLDDPLNAMLNYELANEEQQFSLREHMLKMSGEGLAEEAAADLGMKRAAYDQTFTIIVDLFRKLPAPFVLGFEPPGYASIPIGARSREDWFIGEY